MKIDLFKDRRDLIRRIVAVGLVNYIRNNRGNYGEVTIKKLLKSAYEYAEEFGVDGVVTEEMRRFLRDVMGDYGIGLPIYLVLVRQYMERLGDLGVEVIDGRVIRYKVYREKAPDFWELSKANPESAVKLVMQKLGD